MVQSEDRTLLEGVLRDAQSQADLAAGEARTLRRRFRKGEKTDASMGDEPPAETEEPERAADDS